jgi:hypothetical protein
MDNTSYEKGYIRKKQYGLRERGRSFSDLLHSSPPLGGNDNPGKSLSDMYDMYYINNDEIPPHHDLHKFDSVRILRKRKKNIEIKSKRKMIKRCRCKQ